ncbi:MAG: Patatin [Deltaproteobacteria bacterium]|nr:Patatin [Deltaproteobacteria bacterium]MBS1243624.1 Patatin [Deltaproteobacteria bacterium]
MPMRRPLHVALSLFPLLLLASCAGREVKPVPLEPPPKAVKVAVVLGGGAAKGFAHVGVLKVLEANRVPVHMVVGTSVGSLVGSLYAYGYSSYDLQKVAMGLEKGDLADLTVPDNGFVKGEKLEAYVNRMVRDTTMEHLRTPFYAVATDIGSGQETVFGKGNTGSAVRASCAIPGVFRPVRIGDRTYVDGGLVSPVAVDAARRMGANVVIAVDITGDVDGSVPEGTLDTIFHSINVMYSKIAADQLSRADVVIRPKVGYIASGDFTKRHEAILEGEKAAQEALSRIQALLAEFAKR